MMLRSNLISLSLGFGFSLAVCVHGPGQASDFPGQGSVADWSQALPYYNRGNRYLTQGRYADAISDYNKALSFYDQDPDIYINLGVALRKTEDYAAAEQCYRRAASLSPKDWVVWSDLANVCLKQNRLTETIANFKRAISCGPPAQEKAAMEKDIADINKILKMRMEAAPPPASTAKAGKPAAEKHGQRPVPLAGKPSSNSTTTSKNFYSADDDSGDLVKPKKDATPKVDEKSLHDGGWD